MIISDINEIESRLHVVLPDSYKIFVTDHPFEREDRLKIGFAQILNDKQNVIELNESLRKNGFRRAPWPETLFAIGTLDDSVFFIPLEGPAGVYSVSKGKRLHLPLAAEDCDQYSIEAFADSIATMIRILYK